MINRIKIGSAWAQKDTGECVVVVAANRTGHQYDRYWLLEVMRSDGSINRIEDFVLAANYNGLEEHQENHD